MENTSRSDTEMSVLKKSSITCHLERSTVTNSWRVKIGSPVNENQGWAEKKWRIAVFYYWSNSNSVFFLNPVCMCISDKPLLKYKLKKNNNKINK